MSPAWLVAPGGCVYQVDPGHSQTRRILGDDVSDASGVLHQAIVAGVRLREAWDVWSCPDGIIVSTPCTPCNSSGRRCAKRKLRR